MSARGLPGVVALLALLGGALLPGPARTQTAGDAPGARSDGPPSEGSETSEIWTLVGRFDSGHDVMVEIAVTDVGPGDHSAAVIGHVVFPDGTVRPFRKAKREGEWERSEDGRWIDVGPIALDRRGPEGRFEVDRDSLQLEIRFPSREAVPADAAGPGSERGFEVAQIGEPATGRLRTPEMDAPVALTGRVALVHRWARDEAAHVAWRLDLFDLTQGVGLFLRAGREPEEDVRGCLVQRDDEGAPRQRAAFQARVAWRHEPDPDARVPERITLTGPEVEGWIRLDRPVLRYDPFADLPAPVRWLVALELRMRFAWDAASFELAWKRDADGDARRLSGHAVVGTTKLEPGPLAALDAVPPRQDVAAEAPR